MPGYDIFGSSTRCIDPLTPLPSCAEWWQLEIERLPVGVNYHVHVLPFLRKFSIKREAVRIIAPVRVSELDAVPRLPRPLDQLIESSSRSLMLPVPQYPSRITQTYESEQIRVLFPQRPVEPACLIILAIGVIISALRPANLVAHQDHRYTE